jgi:hypothetical protein
MNEDLKQELKELLLANGFTVKDGHNDLKEYVYDAALAIYKAGYMCGSNFGYTSKSVPPQLKEYCTITEKRQLRDELAMAALKAIGIDSFSDCSKEVSYAYKVADTMLLEREK